MARPKLGDSETERLHVKITADEIKEIEDWRYANRVPSRSEAVRRLVQMGLILSRSFEEIRSAGMDAGKGLLSFDEKRLAALFEIDDIDELRDRLANLLRDAGPAVEAHERLLTALHSLIVPILEMRIEVAEQPFDDLSAAVKDIENEINRAVAEYDSRKDQKS